MLMPMQHAAFSKDSRDIFIGQRKNTSYALPSLVLIIKLVLFFYASRAHV